MSASRDTKLWHPFSDMAAVRGNEFTLVRGEGIRLWDDKGNRYIDGSGSLWYANVGHGRHEIADAVHAQMVTLESYSTFGDLTVPTAAELAERLSALAPVDDGRVFFGMGGGDGTEAAAKLIRLYWTTLGQPERVHIVTRQHAYHGSQAFATSIGGIAANKAGVGPLVEAVSNVAWDSPQALRDEIARLGADRVAAFFCEPVIGAGGVFPPPPGYIEEVAAICAEHGIVFVIDAVICGFGRLGTWFGVERFGVRPDMIVFAKGVTGGYMPLGGVIVGARVAEPFWERPGTMFRHGQTYAGHAACCAAGLATLDIMEREGLVARGRELEGVFLGALVEMVGEHPLVGEVRGGTGLMAAVALKPELVAENPALTAQVYGAVRDEGKVLTRAMLGSLGMSPPLTITEAEIGELAKGVRTGLDAVLRSRG
jgi:putrescine aminotransferase